MTRSGSLAPATTISISIRLAQPASWGSSRPISLERVEDHLGFQGRIALGAHAILGAPLRQRLTGAAVVLVVFPMDCLSGQYSAWRGCHC